MILENRHKPFTLLGTANTVRLKPSVRQVNHVVEGWLKKCEDEHSHLCAHWTVISLPTRVIDVTDEPPRLYQSEGEGESYVCLSYCWGKDENLTTTKDTLSDRLSGIEWDEMPKTFQQAIKITRALNIQYLWIDALCIIQDDHDDWLRESSKMAEVYSGAYLTLCAQSSSGAQGGCMPSKVTQKCDPRSFGEVGSNYPQVHQIDVNVGPNQIGTVHLRQKLSHSVILDEATRSLPGPLLTRGWAYQERLLSNRLVHFTKNELVWECRESMLCECGGISGDIEIKLGRGIGTTRRSNFHWASMTIAAMKFRKEKALLSQREENDDDDDYYGLTGLYDEDNEDVNDNEDVKDNEDIEDKWMSKETISSLNTAWHEAITGYSSLKLKKHTDRLPAVAGLAQRFEDAGLGRYLWGIWEYELPYDICWQYTGFRPWRQSFKPGMQSYEISSSPSWTWASVTGGVMWYGPGSRCNQLEADVQLQDSDKIVVCGNAISGVEVSHDATLNKVILRKGSVQVKFIPDVTDWVYVGGQTSQKHKKQVEVGEFVTCVRILTNERRSVCMALILRASTTIEGTKYLRVGLSNSDTPNVWFEKADRRCFIIE